MNQPTTPNTVEDFPELPESLDYVRAKFRGEWDYVEAGDNYYTADQMRAYVLADRAQRTPAAPVVAEGLTSLKLNSWTDIENYGENFCEAFNAGVSNCIDFLATHPVAGSPAEAKGPTQAMFMAAEKAGVSFATQQKCWAAWFGEPMPASEAASRNPHGMSAAARKHAERIDAMHKGVVGVFAGIKAEYEASQQTLPQSECNAALRAAPAAIVGGPVADIDAPFYDFWYSHMVNDQMTGALSDVRHATARYIWDAATRFRAQGGITNDSNTNLAAPAAPTDAQPDDLPLGYFSQNGGTAYTEVDPKYKGEPDVIPLYRRPTAQSVRDAAQPTIAPEDVRDAQRFRQAIALEDNAANLYAAAMNNAGDADAIRKEFDSAIAATTTTPKD